MIYIKVEYGENTKPLIVGNRITAHFWQPNVVKEYFISAIDMQIKLLVHSLCFHLYKFGLTG